jgi:hypothetical protein
MSCEELHSLCLYKTLTHAMKVITVERKVNKRMKQVAGPRVLVTCAGKNLVFSKENSHSIKNQSS